MVTLPSLSENLNWSAIVVNKTPIEVNSQFFD